MNTDITYMDRKNKAVNKAKSGRQNIRKVGDRYSVLIGSIHIGTFDSEDEAVGRRDAARVKQGLPRALY